MGIIREKHIKFLKKTKDIGETSTASFVIADISPYKIDANIA